MSRPPRHYATGMRYGILRPDESHPDGLRPSVIPLSMVCGAPCSGKTSFCRRRAAPRDLIIDLDLIASGIAGTTAHAWKRDVLMQALLKRNALLAELGGETCATGAWFVIGAPEAAEREWWVKALRPGRVVVLETDVDVSLDRLFADPERQATRAAAVNAIYGWWRRYTRRPGDEIQR
jgi:hypothetical protein